MPNVAAGLAPLGPSLSLSLLVLVLFLHDASSQGLMGKPSDQLVDESSTDKLRVVETRVESRCDHPGNIDYGTASPPFDPSRTYSPGTVITYTCDANYHIVGESKMRCEHLLGWFPMAKPRCAITYNEANDGHRVLEDPLWEAEMNKVRERHSAVAAELRYGETVDLIWDPNTPDSVEEREKLLPSPPPGSDEANRNAEGSPTLVDKIEPRKIDVDVELKVNGETVSQGGAAVSVDITAS